MTFPETIRKGLDFGGFVKNVVGGSTVVLIIHTHKRRAQNGKELDHRREISRVQADTKENKQAIKAMTFETTPSYIIVSSSRLNI